MEKVRSRIKVELIRKNDTDKIIKQKSKLIFNAFHKSYEIMLVIHSDKTMFLWISLFI